MHYQKTIKSAIEFRGVGIHTGHPATMVLKPAERDMGIVFHRVDKGALIKASVSAVSDTAFATTLSNGPAHVRTVEHILAAASGLGVDNLIIELSGPEVPIMDGSAAVFTGGILSQGLAHQSSTRPVLKVTRPVQFRDGRSEITILPYDGRKITYQIDFDHHMLGQQQMTLELDEKTFAEEIAPARTFGFLKDVEALRANGLALGGSMDNAIILSDQGVLNPSGLRYSDEFIRHKILDFIGDISLSGFPIHGHFLVNRSGHSTNTRFLRELLSHPECWHIVTDSSKARANA